MKKILFLTPTLFHGGAERVISELSLHFPKEAELVLVLFEKRISFPFRGRTISLEIPLSPLLFLNIAKLPLRVLKFKRIVAQEKPDVVVSAGASANIVSLLACPKLSVARVDNYVSVSRKGLRGLFFRIALRKLFPRARRIIAVSRAIQEDLIQSYGLSPRTIATIPNPVDVEKITRLAKEPVGKDQEQIFLHKVIITMGRLVPQKAPLALVRSFATVQKEVPDAELVFLGEGPLRSQVQEEARRLGLQERVHLLGWQDNPFRFLARSSVFALSSLWEGLPDALLEALACGLAVVSFDCKSGPREVLDPAGGISKTATTIEEAPYGILVPPKQEALLAKALVRILQDEALCERYRKQARERARHFDINANVRKWDFLFEEDLIQ